MTERQAAWEEWALEYERRTPMVQAPRSAFYAGYAAAEAENVRLRAEQETHSKQIREWEGSERAAVERVRRLEAERETLVAALKPIAVDLHHIKHHDTLRTRTFEECTRAPCVAARVALSSFPRQPVDEMALAEGLSFDVEPAFPRQETDAEQRIEAFAKVVRPYTSGPDYRVIVHSKTLDALFAAPAFPRQPTEEPE